ncbi:hypothetical protein E4195_01355 [Pseudomonas putida]|uniref:hypothetical protein n=1 Tax=Pseudomonas putida TaxID=303 RepID=UPI00107505C0|nr:hypothetical protein [Pseudomonas putida]TFW40137.1 hypothetical protein E4195_01355 [Pseudomonas putida]
MTLTKPNQQLRREFQDLANDLKWSAVELMQIAVRLSQAGSEYDAQAVIRICQVMQAGEDRLVGYGDEVKAGRIERA